jgi:hypothetical protein
LIGGGVEHREHDHAGGHADEIDPADLSLRLRQKRQQRCHRQYDVAHHEADRQRLRRAAATAVDEAPSAYEIDAHDASVPEQHSCRADERRGVLPDRAETDADFGGHDAPRRNRNHRLRQHAVRRKHGAEVDHVLELVRGRREEQPTEREAQDHRDDGVDAHGT